MTAASPRAGSVETVTTTIQIADRGGVYIFPSDAIIQRSSTGMTVIVGHIVKHLSANARVVGNGTEHRWNLKG